MSFLVRSAAVARFAWRWLRAPFWLGFGFIVAFGVPYTLYLDTQVRTRFDDLSWETPSRVYARPLELSPGLPLDAATLILELEAARYDEVTGARNPGSFMRDGDHFVIARRAFAGLDGFEPARRIDVVLSRSRVATIKDLDTGKSLDRVRLDPARIATLYGAEQQERRVAKLGQMPPLLVSGLQAVEDRDFKHHHGVALKAIIRAMWANAMAGHVVQGGSTLTQQLVKNLFLDRTQNLMRKGNEALLALIIEARYDKQRILEAYVNEIFLGQQGGQAVHGFAAASEFYFGRELNTLRAHDVALLVGLVQGPSYYDPRRYPERALGRRNLVLQMFYDTGLLNEDELARAKAAPLGVAEGAGLARNRFPAFLDLVRAQLKREYDDKALRGAGLTVLTSLAPSTQMLAEKAVRDTLAALGKAQKETQAAMVVTGARNGEVQAVVGDRDPDEPGFNRAIDARRPIGSLVKPFVYLVALAQPQRYSLATIIEDAPISLPQPNGKTWMPQNSDKIAHGRVALVDALANSWNLSTVRLGMMVGVDRVRTLLASFGINADVNPNPSLLLGAQEYAPVEVAQLYQYFAADGHALPVIAVRGVLDKDGRALHRYSVKPGAGDYVEAARLVSYALQQVMTSGTASVVGSSELASLNAAGKTGTSDDSRDSWFAGYTGDHLAVAWVGRDDNKPTGLYGSTGALRIWMALFQKLPTRPLDIPMDQGIELVWIDPASGQRTQQDCDQARQLPFLAGYAPSEEKSCAMDQLRDWFGGAN
ncbi:penicillin-binding protein 1B [Tahibacter amnicola]|uniref:Penicillin-binding protein 1B n=1 Tax=Tahibacter amnicola TaxID=2976241 RepID=A0ABY6BBT6_9GAMM|nr:penicillin-binding protein 1B [Tahibacter amnicola]UXI67521.1 penicillin-binding protein 1B [Tahibacter amnicola]